MKITFKEPLSPRYISINPRSNKVHLMVPLVCGQEISTDNTCKATTALEDFFEGGAVFELNTYMEALASDISLLPVGDYVRAKKEGRLTQIEAYIDAISAMRQDYMDSINAFLATPSNLYSIQLRPRAQDFMSEVINPVFSVNRQNNRFGTPLSSLYNKLHEILPSVILVSPEDKLISAVQSQLHGASSFEDIQKALSTQALGVLGREIDFTKDGDGNPVTQDSIDSLMGFDDDVTPKDYIDALLGSCAPDIWVTLPIPPFYSIPQSSSPEDRGERLSILVQFFLANLNVYCISRGISDKNFGVVLDESDVLSHQLVESIWTALNAGEDIERVICNFIQCHVDTFGLSGALTEEDLEVIREKFERTYRTVTATKENPHMDDFMILDIDAGDSAKVVTHQGHLCVNFAEIVSELAASANPDYFINVKKDFRGHPIEIPHKNEHAAGEVDLDIVHLAERTSEEALARFPQSVIDTFCAHSNIQAPPFLVDVAKGKQDEAESLLTTSLEYKQILLQLPSVLTDYSGRTFNCTAYEYAYWAKDTHMCRMLETHMDEETKAQMLARIDAIEAVGLSYEQNGNVHSSAHFDFTPLKEAYQRYLDGYEGWYSARNWAAIEAAFLDVGKEQRTVPAHVAQEYCRTDRSFDPRPEFDEGTLPRSLTFYSFTTYRAESWFPLVTLNSGLGFDFGIVRGRGGPSGARGDVNLQSWNFASIARVDLEALTRLDEVRTADLTLLREHLEPAAMSHGMTM